MNGLIFLVIAYLVAIVYIATWLDAVRNAQDIPESHPDALTGLDVLEAEGVIAAAVHRGGGTVDTARYAIRHHGGAA